MTTPSAEPGPITGLLRRAAAGDEGAEAELLRALYGELHRLASVHMRRERRDHSLQPTALVHEAYVRLLRGSEQRWQDRTHFLATASTVMRRILVDHARRRIAHKRGGGARADAVGDSLEASVGQAPETLVAIDEALSALAASEPRQARIVELRFFSGMTDEESARLLGVSARTVKRDWRLAKAWLYHRLRDQAS